MAHRNSSIDASYLVSTVSVLLPLLSLLLLKYQAVLFVVIVYIQHDSFPCTTPHPHFPAISELAVAGGRLAMAFDFSTSTLPQYLAACLSVYYHKTATTYLMTLISFPFLKGYPDTLRSFLQNIQLSSAASGRTHVPSVLPPRIPGDGVSCHYFSLFLSSSR